MDTPKRLTKGHLWLHDVVVEMGFDVDDEVVFEPYTVDIYVPELHVAVEYDGPKHDGQGQRNKDSERDQYLYDEYRLLVLRISHANQNDLEHVINFLTAGFIYSGTDVEERKRFIQGNPRAGIQTT